MAKIQNLPREIRVLTDKMLSREMRQRIIARRANLELNAAKRHNEAILKRPTEYQQIVDGKKGAPILSVDPDHGTIEIGRAHV